MEILMVTIEAGGNMPPVLNLTKQLVMAGHKVRILGEPCLKELVENTGAQFFPFKEYFTKTDRNKDMFEDWKSKNNGFENVLFGPAEIVVKETIEHIKIHRTDALIVDVVLPAGLMAGEAMHIPRISLFHMPEYMPASNRPPGGLGMVPGKGALGHFRDRLLGKVFHKIFNKYLPKFNAIRKSLDLTELKNVVDVFHEADLRLIQTSKTFDFPILPAPANVKYTGPVLDDPDWVSTWKNPWPIEDLRPLVVVSLSSTFQNQKQPIIHCIEALGKLSVRGLVTLGPAMEGEVFSTPDNVKVIANGSHAEIFPHADCVVTHAGHGTVMRALANGAPMVCMPMGRDQGDNAAKVVYHGVGLALSSKSSPQKISKAIQNVLGDKSYKTNARVLGDKIIEDSKNGNIVSEIEKLMK